jgi:molybdopterin molybdotransferase
MLPLEKAIKIILKNVKAMGNEIVPIKSSLGRVLGENIFAKENIPSFDRSAMDGYAVKYTDTESATNHHPVILEVLESIAAGYSAKSSITYGKAIRIMTGAPMPRGADSVVMLEDTEIIKRGGKEFVKILRSSNKLENVSFAGEDVRKGEFILHRGKCLRPADVGMLATLGLKKVTVVKKPKVAIISTGDEVVETSRKRLKKGQIRDSNSYALYSLVLACGGEPERIGIARDRREDLIKLLKVSEDSDMVLLSGGVSVGSYDIVKDVLISSFGVHPLFWKVAIRPGKPIFCGIKNGRLFFGLPGYPVSSMVTFELFIRPTIKAMLGRLEEEEYISAILDKNIVRKERRNFLRGLLTFRGGRYHVVPVSIQKSSALKSMVIANSLIDVPIGKGIINKGEMVRVRRII